MLDTGSPEMAEPASGGLKGALKGVWGHLPRTPSEAPRDRR